MVSWLSQIKSFGKVSYRSMIKMWEMIQRNSEDCTEMTQLVKAGIGRQHELLLI